MRSIRYKVTEKSVEEFFAKLDSREDSNTVYDTLFKNLLFYLKSDGGNFVLTVNNVNKQIIKDVDRKLQILHHFRQHFIDVEYYEILGNLDKLISKHEEISDSVNIT